MTWLRWYGRRCRSVGRAAWIFLRTGDEDAFDLRLARLDAPDPFAELALAIRLVTHSIGVALQPALVAALKAANEFGAHMERIRVTIERGQA